MARNIDPKCRLCRRIGEKLFLKGDRCYSSKCALVKRKYPPGMHGSKRKRKVSEYGVQLKEKQKAKYIYGILEKQFRNYFKKAAKKKGDTGVYLFQFLESRLDNAIYRVNLFPSKELIRQMITHGHIKVNNRKVNIPSYQVKQGEIIKIKENSSYLKKARELSKEKKGEIPGWLFFDQSKLEIKVLNLPTAEDFPKNIDIKLIIEFYSR
ncbi:MAG: ribosomal protein S4P [Parcubacteria group bacterium Athens1014_10]|nr:MAG: ribosomal protein S4P [Parcubacteria group bacterium Athens1014_10]TSD06056.1 MAG: ribosomal protein S4P [Parcubacteria group bacterium Athens0714_12]